MKQENVVLEGEKLQYWRSVDNRHRTEAYLKSIEDEFAPDMTDISAMDRRSMLKVMGASIALSGMGLSCRRPEEKILPYVKEPEDFQAGVPKFFATAFPSPLGANPVLVESHEGRPTKIEGNPSHPSSMGKATALAQASILELYDPDRSRFVRQNKAGDRHVVEWSEWDVFARGHFSKLRSQKGKGFAVLCNGDLSPTFIRLKKKLLSAYPEAKFYIHEPMSNQNLNQASEMAFGVGTRTRYNFDQAKIMVSIFADPFALMPESLRNMNGYGKNRSIYKPADAAKMSRLYAVEADFSLTGVNADHRMRLPVAMSKAFLEALAYELHATQNLDIDLSLKGAKTLGTVFNRPPSYKGLDKKFIIALAKDLALHKGRALLVAGDHLAPELSALVHLLNLALGGLNKTFEVLKLDEDSYKHLHEPSLLALAEEIGKNQIDTLLIFGTNPVYDAPKNLDFAQKLSNVPNTIHMGLYDDETAEKALWHLPKTHYLEQFSDIRSFDGSISVIQPLIQPLHNARSDLQLMAQILDLDQKPLDMVKESVSEYSKGQSFEKIVHDGLASNTGFIKPVLSLDCEAIFNGLKNLKTRQPSKDSFELVLNFDRKVLDGRYGNHSWLQELPEPVTKMAWDNALLMSPVAARELGIKSGVKKNAYVADQVKVSTENGEIEAPVFVVPGQNEYSLVLALGYGRTKAGTIGDNVGVNAYTLVFDYQNLVLNNVKITRLEKTHRIATTQEQFAMNGDVVQEVDVLTMQSRDPARITNIREYAKDPLAAKKKGITQGLLVDEPGSKTKVPLQITDAWDYSKGNQWGMVIDLAKCTGCNACVVACQSENNIPVVGKEQVIRGRIMHWLRIDRYFLGDVKAPMAIAQPIPCMHCENAPCEPVCPVAATAHDHEGLNAMAYNRCIGTRYCANNCPYKVRRFNYFDFSHTAHLHVEASAAARQKTLKLQRNPDVTVRFRGVMEKCTFCTQRIQEAKMVARREGRDHNNLPDGSVTTACQQTCPAEAISFGSINDPSSKVSELKGVDRNYTLLDILNARPRTSYLSKLRNPNPDLVA